MAVNDFSNQNIQDTYQRVVQTDGTNLADGTGSALPIKFEGPNLIVSGAVRANSYIVSESILVVTSGSTVMGNSFDDTHTFSGSININDRVDTGYNTITPSLFVRQDAVDRSQIANGFGGSIDFHTQRGSNASGARTGRIASRLTAGSQTTNDFYALDFNLRSNDTQIDLMTLHTSNTNTAGRVGILDTTPSYTLDVNGSFRATGDINAHGDIKGDGSTKIGSILQITSSVVSSSGHIQTPILIGNPAFPTELEISGILKANSITSSGHISSSGGTVTAKQLTLGHASRVDIKFTNVGDEDHYIRKDGDFLRFRGHDDSTVLFELKNNSNGSNITSFPNGNHGIGTTNPTEKLQVVGNISASGNIITEGHITASGNISASGTNHTLGGDLTIKDDLIVDGGNVTINGGNVADSILKLATNTAGASDDVIIELVTDEDGTPRQARIGVDHSDNTLKLVHGSGFSGGTNGICVDSGGKVGIGIAAPTEELEIYRTGENAQIAITRGTDTQLKLKAQDNQTRITYEGGPLLFDRDESGTNALTLGVGGHITASGHISASGGITGSHIFADGNISASGDVIASNVFMPAGAKISFDDDLDGSDQFIIGGENYITIDGDEFVKLRADDHVRFQDNSGNVFASINPNAGHITSSGNISASGDITANNHIGQRMTIATLSQYVNAVGGDDAGNGSVNYYYGNGNTGLYSTAFNQFTSTPETPDKNKVHNSFILPCKLKNIQAKIQVRGASGVKPTFWFFTGSRQDGAGTSGNPTYGFAASSSVNDMPGTPDITIPSTNGFYNVDITGSRAFPMTGSDDLIRLYVRNYANNTKAIKFNLILYGETVD